MVSLLDKVVIITGASAGIGASLARHLVQFKPKLVFVSIDLENLKNVADECTQLGLPSDSGLVVHCDISKEGDISKLVNKTIEKYQRIDVLINNAGIGGTARSLEMFDKLYRTNMRGPYHLTQLCIPHLIKTKGVIVNVGSVIGHHLAAPRLMLYGTIKAAVEHLTRTMAADLAPLKVRVNAVCPGFVLTDIGGRKDMPPEVKQKYIETHSKSQHLTGAIEPVEIAKTITFLACDDSCAMTGQLICIDGGHDGTVK